RRFGRGGMLSLPAAAETLVEAPDEVGSQALAEDRPGAVVLHVPIGKSQRRQPAAVALREVAGEDRLELPRLQGAARHQVTISNERRAEVGVPRVGLSVVRVEGVAP